MSKKINLAYLISLLLIFTFTLNAAAQAGQPAGSNPLQPNADNFKVYLPFMKVSDTTPPTVISASPTNGTSGVAVTTDVILHFSETLKSDTVSTSTFELRNAAQNKITITVNYNATTYDVTLHPTNNLANSVTYSAKAIGGTAGVKDADGNPLAANYTSSFTTVAAPPNGAIIVDHTTMVKFGSVPLANLQAAAAIKTLFMHQSTGGNIDYLGMQCLAGLHADDPNFPQECLNYALNPYSPYDDRNWNWQLWSDPMADAIAKTDQWVSVVNAQHQNYQVLGMKFCYVDGWNQDFNYYKTNMEALEKAYPNKTFIWTTEVLWDKSEVDGNSSLVDSATNIQDFNQQVRAYAIANKKVLYDMADIESHDTNGNFCQSNGIEALCDGYYTGFAGGGGGHPDVIGSIRLAKGFWLVMARLGGWNGN
jgi:hypothetical protein